MTPSEKFVASLCERSFLRLWTHPNPKGKKNKELCDCLIVCGPHIVIISVKECGYKNTGDKTGWERWEKVAIEKSASQIWGAERWLQTVDKVLRHDGRWVSLPAKAERRYLIHSDFQIVPTEYFSFYHLSTLPHPVPDKKRIVSC